MEKVYVPVERRWLVDGKARVVITSVDGWDLYRDIIVSSSILIERNGQIERSDKRRHLMQIRLKDEETNPQSEDFDFHVKPQGVEISIGEVFSLVGHSAWESGKETSVRVAKEDILYETGALM